MRWNGQEEDSEPEDTTDSTESKPPLPNRAAAADNDEGWTDWKNGEDVRKRFIRKTPGRIIHLGDGSELFTDRGAQFEADEDTSDGEDHPEKSSEEEVDGVEEHAGKNQSTEGEERHQSPFPQTFQPPSSPHPAQ